MEELAEKLKKLIGAEVSKKVRDIKGSVEHYENFIDEFIETLEDFESNGRDMLEDCKSNKLKFSEAEAEGFLRAVITIKNHFKQNAQYLNAT